VSCRAFYRDYVDWHTLAGAQSAPAGGQCLPLHKNLQMGHAPLACSLSRALFEIDRSEG